LNVIAQGRAPFRAARARADGVDLAAGRTGTEGGGSRAAHLALTRAHADGRVTLERLDVVEALGDGLVDVLDGDVFAEADEALAET